MKRCLLWIKLCVMACILGFSSGAKAQSYQADENEPLITVVSPDGETQLTSNCTWKPAKGNDNYLPENNEAYYDAGNYLGTLIDGNLSTYWHSDPIGMNLNNQDCYIQVDLMRDDLTRMFFMLNRREDVYNGTTRYGSTPVKLEIQATNTPDDKTSWKLITTLTDIQPSTTEGCWPYMSLIETSEPYRYFRLVPRQSASIAGQAFAYWTISEIQFYPAVEIIDKKKILQNVVDSIYDLNRDFAVGEGIGYVSQKAYDEYNNTFAASLDQLDNPSATDEILLQAIANLRNAIAKITASVTPITDGWYFIEAADTSFYSKQGVKKAFYSDDTRLYWGTEDSENPFYYYYVKRAEDGNFIIQNGGNDKYLYYVDGNAWVGTVYMRMADTDTVHQIVTPLGNGSFYIANTKNTLPLHPLSHNNGSGSFGSMVPASIYEPVSTWKFVPVDASKLEDLKAIQVKKDRAAALSDSLGDARKLILSIKAPTTGLIASASQLSTNCFWLADNDVDKLIDGNHNTHFHSTTGMNLFNQDEYLQIDLGHNDISKFTIEHWGRNDGAVSGINWHDTPTKYIVKVTNTPEDEDSWKEIATLDKGFPGNIHNAHYVSPLVNMNGTYQYIRLYVKNTSSGNPYWNLSELQLYPEDIPASETSLYNTNADVKKGLDDLTAALAVAQDHIDNLTVDGTEMVAINENVEKVNAIIASFDSIQAVVDEANKLNSKLYVNATEGGLIQEVNTKNDGTNQLTANNTWMTITSDNDNYSFNAEFIEDGYNLLGALIDNNNETYWHSDPNWINLDEHPSYLQADLKRSDVSSFLIYVDRRNDLYAGSRRHGVPPVDAIIYGTNDESLAADINSDLSSWTKITELKDFPAVDADSEWPYYSKDITPDQPYRYIRFRCYESNGHLPYWTISGFQIYDSKDRYNKEKSQYEFVEGMKEAADKMNAIAKSVQEKLDNGSAIMADCDELKAAIEAVEALYQDQPAVNKLVKKANSLIENTTTGDYMGQLQDESKLTELQTAIGAVAGTQTSTAKFNENKKNLEDAIEAVYDNIVSVEPGKWYYVLSATAEDDSAPENYYGARPQVKDAALYVLGTGKGENEGDYNPGNQLRWGMDDIKNKEREGDIDAIWRFIPVPDSLNLGKHAYYIQNMRTGWYFGNANTGDNDYYFSGSVTPFPFLVEFIGKEQFHIQALAGTRAGALISFGDNARQVRGDLFDSDFDTRASFTFEEFDAEENPEIVMQFDNNTAKIVTLPFAVTELGRNDNVHAFQIHSQPSDTELGLVEVFEIPAGQPFILVTGDTTLYEADQPKVALNFDTPADLTIVGDTVNGLVPAFPSKKLSAAGFGYFSGNALKVTDGEKSVTVTAHSGYIMPNLIVAQEGEPDVVISTFEGGILNSIKKAVSKLNTTVNVYTVDGALVKRNVKASDAKKGLKKGLYIIGKEKVLVK